MLDDDDARSVKCVGSLKAAVQCPFLSIIFISLQKQRKRVDGRLVFLLKSQVVIAVRLEATLCVRVCA